jgi:EAL and modified HD-GYP domain-containing signal transduction protein
MLEHARIVKVEIGTLTIEEHKALVARYRKLGLKMLAEKVETPEQYSELRNLGYDYFQGYFFAKPIVIQSKQIPVMKLNAMRLLREITRPELDLNRLADMISTDVALSYGMLRYVNTAQFAVSRRVASVRQAMLYPSEAQLRKWVAMAVLPKASADKASELLTSSLVRAQMCELLARMTHFHKPEKAFLMGLFSFLDALLDQPLEVALAGVGLAGPILAALLGTAAQSDPLTAIYDLVRSYETGDWDLLAGQMVRLGVNDDQIRNAYCESVTWAEKSMRDMEAHAKQCP